MTRALPVVRATLSQQVFTEIKQRIMHGELQPGDRLNETELAATLGVSPTPVREALHKLRGDGLAVYSAWQGTTVVQLTARDVSQLHDIRLALECLAVREAVVRLSADDYALLDALLAKAPDAIAAADFERLHQLNETFHQLFLTRSENRWLQQMLGGISDLLILSRRPLTLERSGRETWAEHAQIVDALRAGNPAAAEAAMASHIERIKRQLLAHPQVEQHS